MVDPNFLNIRNVPGKIPREQRVSKAEGAPSSKKDFKKVMRKKEGEEKDKDDHRKQTKDATNKDKENPEIQEDPTKEAAGEVSLFTLSQNTSKKAVAPQEQHTEGQEVAAVQSDIKPDVKQQETKQEPAPFFNENATVKKEEPKAQFSQEQPDIAYVNPLNVGQAISTAAPTPEVQRPMLSPEQIQQIVTQMVDKMQTMTKEGQTDTTIILKHPPILEGANLIIRSFDTARGEFNVAFENLSLQAKNMLDMQGNQDALKLGLENKGYVMHIFTATTTTETPIIEEEGQANLFARQDQEGQDEQQKDQDKG